MERPDPLTVSVNSRHLPRPDPGPCILLTSFTGTGTTDPTTLDYIRIPDPLDLGTSTAPLPDRKETLDGPTTHFRPPRPQRVRLRGTPEGLETLL